MKQGLSEMEKFNFLLGHWDMEYNVPNSDFSEAKTGTGNGTFKRGWMINMFILIIPH